MCVCHAPIIRTQVRKGLALNRGSSRDHNNGWRQAISHGRGKHRPADVERTTRRTSSRCQCLRRDRRGQHARSRRSLRSRRPSGAFRTPPRTPFPSILQNPAVTHFSLHNARDHVLLTRRTPPVRRRVDSTDGWTTSRASRTASSSASRCSTAATRSSSTSSPREGILIDPLQLAAADGRCSVWDAMAHAIWGSMSRVCMRVVKERAPGSFRVRASVPPSELPLSSAELLWSRTRCMALLMMSCVSGGRDWTV